jgi:acetyl-CoA C-acetyltransferase
VARSCSISREDQDAFAVESQEKAAYAIKSGVFAEQIVPVETYQKRSTGVPELIVEDEFPRPATTPASLAKLKPAFLHDGTGTVTAGNSTGLNDGAAYCVLMSEKEARERHILPLARIVAYSQVGIEPDIMGFGPVPAVKAVVRDS